MIVLLVEEVLFRPYIYLTFLCSAFSRNYCGQKAKQPIQQLIIREGAKLMILQLNCKLGRCIHFLFCFVCISLIMADGSQRARLPIPPTATLPSCLWSRKIFSSLPDSCLRTFIAMQIQNSHNSSTIGWILLTHVLTPSERKPEDKFCFFHKN